MISQRVLILDTLLRSRDEEWFDKLATPELINHRNHAGVSLMSLFCLSEEMLKKLITKGGNINILIGNDRNLIHFAASAGRCKIIRFLVQMGCNVNYQDPFDGSTALQEDYFIDNSNLKVAKTLLECGANPLIRDRSGKTVLDYAPDSNRKLIYFTMIRCKLAERAFIDAMRRRKNVMVPDVIQLTACMIWSTRRNENWLNY